MMSIFFFASSLIESLRNHGVDQIKVIARVNVAIYCDWRKKKLDSGRSRRKTQKSAAATVKGTKIEAV